MPIQFRRTRQKDAIQDAFREANRPLSPDETLVAAQQKVKSISLATVYRNITSLMENGWLEPVNVPGKATRYELAGKEHHHHFHCNGCGKVYDLDGCALGGKPKLPRGFRTTGHQCFIFGTCSDCR